MAETEEAKKEKGFWMRSLEVVGHSIIVAAVLSVIGLGGWGVLKSQSLGEEMVCVRRQLKGRECSSCTASPQAAPDRVLAPRVGDTYTDAPE